jgi:RHS repeat-associated protein
VGTPGSQTVKAQYTWSPTDRWTMIRRKRSTTSTLNEVLYVLKDYLDPAALFSTATSEIVERFGFDAFGPVRFMDKDFAGIGSSVYDWNFLFHAEFMDQESGLYNYGYRFYHTALGRWLSRDPIGEIGGLNLYGILANRVTNNIDVLGTACQQDPFFSYEKKKLLGEKCCAGTKTEWWEGKYKSVDECVDDRKPAYLTQSLFPGGRAQIAIDAGGAGGSIPIVGDATALPASVQSANAFSAGMLALEECTKCECDVPGTYVEVLNHEYGAGYNCGVVCEPDGVRPE